MWAQASTETAVIGASQSGLVRARLASYKAPHFQYMSGPQARPKA